MSKTTDYANTPPRTMPTKFAYQEKEIKRLQTELDAMRLWSQAAYTRLSGSIDSVSAEDELVLRKLLQDAPEAVKGGEK